MVDRNHVARLMDFGIAKSQDGGSGGASTATGHVLGTPEYMSPEQAQGKKLDARSDVYALGVVIYEIFTGAVPFRGDTPISTILKHLHDPPPLDGQKVPPTLRPVLRRALAKEPEQRFATATALAEALREARSPSRKQQPLPTAALEAPTLPRPTAPAPSGRSFAPWLLSVPIVALGAGVWLLRGPAAPAPNVASVVTPSPLPAPPTTTTAVPPTSPPEATAPPSLPHATLPPTTRPPPRPRPLPVAPAPPQVDVVVPATVPTTTAPAEPGTLQIVVRPWAEVSIDGRVLGTTPMDRVSLSAGTHSVTLKHPAFDALKRGVTIRPGEHTKLVVDLAVEATKKP
jgi:serine/threonine-protein kinase